jgi:hypothetical protein
VVREAVVAVVLPAVDPAVVAVVDPAVAAVEAGGNHENIQNIIT